ncbi:hypothetical protein ASE80_25900 [Pseudomonas sp. Leaf15]|nr:hypothetical protein ASE80_25900 [Pseudomonas sp. Leaf15]
MSAITPPPPSAKNAQFSGTIGEHPFNTTEVKVEQLDDSIAFTAIHRDDGEDSEEIYIKFPKTITTDEKILRLFGSKTESVWVQFKTVENPRAHQYVEGSLTLQKTSDHPYAVSGSVYAVTQDPKLKLDVKFEVTV